MSTEQTHKLVYKIVIQYYNKVQRQKHNLQCEGIKAFAKVQILTYNCSNRLTDCHKGKPISPLII